MTDNDIIDHFKSKAYGKAVKGMYPLFASAKKFIKANSGTEEDAKDIFQDALVVLCQKFNAGNLFLTVPLKVYLMAVVKNCWLQELRRRNKLPEGNLPGEIAEPIVEDEPGFADARAAFHLLGEKCRQLLVLFYFKKKSFKEIAAILSFSDEKVAKNQKYRCIQKAKEHYVTLAKTGQQ